jgi:carboxylesterase
MRAPVKRWCKRGLWAVAAGVFLCLGCRTVTGRLVDREDARVPRNPETGIMLGAEEFDVGPEPGEAKGAALLVHGYAGATNNFGELPDALAAHGWHVRAMRLPGHGTSPRDLEQRTPDELLEAVSGEARRLLGTYPKVVLVGHSMGGALCTLAAARESGAGSPVDGLVLGGAYFGVTYRWYYLLPPEAWIRLGRPFLRWVYKGTLFLQVNREEVKDEIVAYTWLPSKSGLTLVEVGRRANEPAVLDAVQCPVLMLHAPGDVAASPKAVTDAVDRMASSSKRTVWLERSNHHIFWDWDRETVVAEVIRFLDGLE